MGGSGISPAGKTELVAARCCIFPTGGAIQGPLIKTGILIVVDGLNSEVHDERRRAELTE